MEIYFDEKELQEIDKLKTRYQNTHSVLIPALWMIQEKYGWISEEAMKYLGDLLHINYEHILGVVSFYTMFCKKPKGKFHLQICTNVSCMLRGAYELYEYVKAKVGITENEISEDEMFSIEEVECLGSCATAPVMQVNNKDYYENLTKEKLDSIIETFKQQYDLSHK
ncbi:MAG: NADH-quinone oxidoreductase subunit NuoE [Ignavibacteria bacterium]